MRNKHINKTIYVIYDLLAVLGISFLTLWILKDDNYQDNIVFFNLYVFILMGITLVSLFIFRLYRSIWRYASVTELLRILAASFIITLINLIVVRFTGYLSSGWAILYGISYFNALCFSRFFLRIIRRLNVKNSKKVTERVMIVGAGDAANLLIKELLESNVSSIEPCCIIDDEINKHNIEVEGIKVVGTTQDIPRLVVKYMIDTIIIAIPSLDAKTKSRIIRICQDTKCKIKIMPNIYDFMDEKNAISHMRTINLDDLNEREKIQVNKEEIENLFKEKTVLICGAAGKIGQKLSIEISRLNIKKLILLDVSDGGLLSLKTKILKVNPSIEIETILASIRSIERLETVFQTFKPEIVYNLASNNKVLIMEKNKNEVVKNNIIGAKNLTILADKYQVQNFYLVNYNNVSNHENIISKSNKIIEKMLSSMNESKTKYTIITCGDLAHGKDACILRFYEELVKSSKITLDTRNEMIFLLSEEEIVLLILEASQKSLGNQNFIIDLSEQEKIYDLALKVVKVLGYNLNVDVEIEILDKYNLDQTHKFIVDKDEFIKTDHNYIYVKQMVNNKKSLWEDILKLYNEANNEVDNIDLYLDKIIIDD